MQNLSLTDRFLRALEEDCPTGDVTATLFGDRERVNAVVVSRETGVFSGLDWVRVIQATFSDELQCDCLCQEGDHFQPGDTLVTLKGPSGLVVKVERVLLNLLQHLCGVATTTQAYVAALGDASIDVLDTRKTLPLWRDVEKAAVCAGGGKNHRHNLSDMILIKENHLTAFLADHSLSDLGSVLAKSKAERPQLPIEIELETLAQCQTYPLESVDYILLDNFTLDTLVEAVNVLRERGILSQIEVSGNVSLETISQYRGLPIDRISIGRLTHSVKAVDLSLLIEE